MMLCRFEGWAVVRSLRLSDKILIRRVRLICTHTILTNNCPHLLMCLTLSLEPASRFSVNLIAVSLVLTHLFIYTPLSLTVDSPLPSNNSLTLSFAA